MRYLAVDPGNVRAGASLLDDAKDTIEALSCVAGSLPFCSASDLSRRGIRKTLFTRHRYLWLYQVAGDTAQVKAMYHELQDYENTFRNEDN